MFCSMTCFGFHPEVVGVLDDILTKFKEEHKEDRKIECLLPNQFSKLLENERFKMKLYPAEEQHNGLTAPGDEDVVKKMLSEKII
ncbi:hypothetical protein COU54_04215 [Candidatus Pacearchaeota archaeon CG10_big_fil_rev_8_21_14_0_10_31_24]|nr:MAG: hypothetical protein COU54_04215 [Candidatus Pacearchaeota archaeon CG10_big_fil_rev_8_21_14_0_10_31_24]